MANFKFQKKKQAKLEKNVLFLDLYQAKPLFLPKHVNL